MTPFIHQVDPFSRQESTAVKPGERSRRIFVLLLSLLGTAALFLPFTYDLSPWRAVRIWNDWFGGPVGFLGTPSFLVIPILAWQARGLLASRLSAFEITAAYVFSVGGMISVLWFTVLLLMEKGLEMFRHVELAMIIGSCWVLTVANFVLLWRNLAKRITREAIAEAFLLGGYLPNAVFCLFAYGRDGRLQAGAWLIAVVCIGYVVTIALALRSELAVAEKAHPSL